jgi:hypothetical protein
LLAAAVVAVVVLECVAGSSKKEEWDGGNDVVQEGDVGRRKGCGNDMVCSSFILADSILVCFIPVENEKFLLQNFMEGRMIG